MLNNQGQVVVSVMCLSVCACAFSAILLSFVFRGLAPHLPVTTAVPVETILSVSLARLLTPSHVILAELGIRFARYSLAKFHPSVTRLGARLRRTERQRQRDEIQQDHKEELQTKTTSFPVTLA